MSRKQKCRAMNEAHLASPIKGELGYAQRPIFGLPNSLPYWKPNLGPIRERRCLPYLCPKRLANLCSAIRATLGQRQIRQSPGLALNAHSGNDWGSGVAIGNL